MVVREKFEIELNKLREMLLELGRMTKDSLVIAMESLVEQDIEKALSVIEDDSKIDKLELELNDFAILLIAKQSPVAVDLRRIIVSLKIAADIERMADHAVNIAKSTIRIGSESLIKPLDDLPKMHKLSIEMLEESLRAYNEEDLVLAKRISEIDDRVDEMYGVITKELLSMMPKYPDHIAQITQLAFVARYIERTADHATNIGENIFYQVKGQHYDLNA
ncbi:phosphate signaling complex protein PhoU [Bacillus suaedaesalsae]|uniref:Phosphate-specific transport system accessory protein PhoU n=1 Tax=Bacillus suaedaesalsae TaxID=2810349 RepID=A0ABS2DFL2_9BACI|nr:phosphate signaling complex protein PhoU [Bacillus suaedaesalsae]MBM6617245.1 phosphate signaling complex protein PhoU [Bacillus suaedaesalsae]